jgi:hypothetical protein
MGCAILVTTNLFVTLVDPDILMELHDFSKTNTALLPMIGYF